MADGYIGVGHGRRPDGVYDPGARSGGLVEHLLAHEVCNAYAETVREAGVDVIVEQDSGAGHDPNWQGSARRANAQDVAWADETHFNAGGGTGVEVLLHTDTTDANRNFARQAARNISDVLNIPVRRGDGLHIVGWSGFLNSTDMPSALIEVAFLDHDHDRAAIQRQGALAEVGQAIAEARAEYMEIAMPLSDDDVHRISTSVLKRLGGEDGKNARRKIAENVVGFWIRPHEDPSKRRVRAVLRETLDEVRSLSVGDVDVEALADDLTSRLQDSLADELAERLAE